MPVLQLSVADFAALMQSMLPRGAVWPRDPDTVQTQCFAALAPTYKRLNDRCNNLLVDAFPATTNELLSDWESSLGLPDPCLGQSPSVELRRAHVVAKLTLRGGQSIEYFEAIAAAIGYAISITPFSPFRVGVSRVGTPLYGRDWAFAWQVNAPATTIQPFRVGQSAVGDPLRAWGNTALECLIREYAPAHTIVLFAYS